MGRAIESILQGMFILLLGVLFAALLALIAIVIYHCPALIFVPVAAYFICLCLHGG